MHNPSTNRSYFKLTAARERRVMQQLLRHKRDAFIETAGVLPVGWRSKLALSSALFQKSQAFLD
jgi:hypothetical protein